MAFYPDIIVGFFLSQKITKFFLRFLSFFPDLFALPSFLSCYYPTFLYTLLIFIYVSSTCPILSQPFALKFNFFTFFAQLSQQQNSNFPLQP